MALTSWMTRGSDIWGIRLIANTLFPCVINMLVQDTFISIIRFVFNILILKYIHVIQKWFLYKGQKSRTLRHCSKCAHTWELFKNPRKFPSFYEKLQKLFSLFAFNLWKKNVSIHSNLHDDYYDCTWNYYFRRFRHNKMKITGLGFRLFRLSPMWKP